MQDYENEIRLQVLETRKPQIPLSWQYLAIGLSCPDFRTHWFESIFSRKRKKKDETQKTNLCDLEKFCYQVRQLRQNKKVALHTAHNLSSFLRPLWYHQGIYSACFCFPNGHRISFPSSSSPSPSNSSSFSIFSGHKFDLDLEFPIPFVFVVIHGENEKVSDTIPFCHALSLATNSIVVSPEWPGYADENLFKEKWTTQLHIVDRLTVFVNFLWSSLCLALDLSHKPQRTVEGTGAETGEEKEEGNREGRLAKAKSKWLSLLQQRTVFISHSSLGCSILTRLLEQQEMMSMNFAGIVLIEPQSSKYPNGQSQKTRTKQPILIWNMPTPIFNLSFDDCFAEICKRLLPFLSQRALSISQEMNWKTKLHRFQGWVSKNFSSKKEKEEEKEEKTNGKSQNSFSFTFIEIYIYQALLQQDPLPELVLPLLTQQMVQAGVQFSIEILNWVVPFLVGVLFLALLLCCLFLVCNKFHKTTKSKDR